MIGSRKTFAVIVIIVVCLVSAIPFLAFDMNSSGIDQTNTTASGESTSSREQAEEDPAFVGNSTQTNTELGGDGSSYSGGEVSSNPVEGVNSLSPDKIITLGDNVTGDVQLTHPQHTDFSRDPIWWTTDGEYITIYSTVAIPEMNISSVQMILQDGNSSESIHLSGNITTLQTVPSNTDPFTVIKSPRANAEVIESEFSAPEVSISIRDEYGNIVNYKESLVTESDTLAPSQGRTIALGNRTIDWPPDDIVASVPIPGGVPGYDAYDTYPENDLLIYHAGYPSAEKLDRCTLVEGSIIPGSALPGNLDCEDEDSVNLSERDLSDIRNDFSEIPRTAEQIANDYADDAAYTWAQSNDMAFKTSEGLIEVREQGANITLSEYRALQFLSISIDTSGSLMPPDLSPPPRNEEGEIDLENGDIDFDAHSFIDSSGVIRNANVHSQGVTSGVDPRYQGPDGTELPKLVGNDGQVFTFLDTGFTTKNISNDPDNPDPQEDIGLPDDELIRDDVIYGTVVDPRVDGEFPKAHKQEQFTYEVVDVTSARNLSLRAKEGNISSLTGSTEVQDNSTEGFGPLLMPYAENDYSGVIEILLDATITAVNERWKWFRDREAEHNVEEPLIEFSPGEEEYVAKQTEVHVTSENAGTDISSTIDYTFEENVTVAKTLDLPIGRDGFSINNRSEKPAEYQDGACGPGEYNFVFMTVTQTFNKTIEKEFGDLELTGTIPADNIGQNVTVTLDTTIDTSELAVEERRVFHYCYWEPWGESRQDEGWRLTDNQTHYRTDQVDLTNNETEIVITDNQNISVRQKALERGDGRWTVDIDLLLEYGIEDSDLAIVTENLHKQYLWSMITFLDSPEEDQDIFNINTWPQSDSTNVDSPWAVYPAAEYVTYEERLPSNLSNRLMQPVVQSHLDKWKPRDEEESNPNVAAHPVPVQLQTHLFSQPRAPEVITGGKQGGVGETPYLLGHEATELTAQQRLFDGGNPNIPANIGFLVGPDLGISAAAGYGPGAVNPTAAPTDETRDLIYNNFNYTLGKTGYHNIDKEELDVEGTAFFDDIYHKRNIKHEIANPLAHHSIFVKHAPGPAKSLVSIHGNERNIALGDETLVILRVTPQVHIDHDESEDELEIVVEAANGNGIIRPLSGYTVWVHNIEDGPIERTTNENGTVRINTSGTDFNYVRVDVEGDSETDVFNKWTNADVSNNLTEVYYSDVSAETVELDTGEKLVSVPNLDSITLDPGDTTYFERLIYLLIICFPLILLYYLWEEMDIKI